MKNIVICFDGTWNTSDAPHPTNVVKTARLLLPMDRAGMAQVVFYDSGVGSDQVAFAKSINSLLGGAFGVGLMNNIEDAYRFLIFNYSPGDRIFVFGFSRGAFSARSFGGLLRNCGILRREHLNQLGKAISLYKNRDPELGPDAEASLVFRRDHSVPAWSSPEEREWRIRNFDPSAASEGRLQIEYMGIWDTVGAMGVPGHLFFANFFNKRFRFHDCNLSRMVKSARHAVAIDERRRIFDATLWTNIGPLNELAAKGAPIDKRPYLQQWFPGDHGSVGGGGDEVGLSDATLAWVVDGAVALGLGVDTAKLEEHRRNVNHLAPLHNLKTPAFDVTNLATRKSRNGPDAPDYSDLSDIARLRLGAPAEKFPRKKPYLPRPLRAIAKRLAQAAAAIKKAA